MLVLREGMAMLVISDLARLQSDQCRHLLCSKFLITKECVAVRILFVAEIMTMAWHSICRSGAEIFLIGGLSIVLSSS